jgi:hypothetical protein
MIMVKLKNICNVIACSKKKMVIKMIGTKYEEKNLKGLV